jgi:hypothetical protein
MLHPALMHCRTVAVALALKKPLNLIVAFLDWLPFMCVVSLLALIKHKLYYCVRFCNSIDKSITLNQISENVLFGSACI